MQVVVTFSHPAAVVHRCLRLDWVVAPGNAATALKRDSRSLVGAWREHFSDTELATIHRITAPVADRYYPNAW